MKTTRYFEEQVLRKRPYILREWCEAALATLERTAKPCGPGTPTLVSSFAEVSARRRWLKSPAHRGDHGISRKTIAQGMPV